MPRVQFVVPGAVLLGLLLLLVAAPASATISGPCTASGDFFAVGNDTDQPDASVDVAGTGETVIPPAGSVAWRGAVQRGTAERDYSGAVFIDTAIDDLFEFLSVDPEINTWSGDDETGNDSSGTELYDVDTNLIPGGAKITVSGFHTDDVGTCTGSTTLALTGSPWSSPTTIAAAAGSALFLLLAFVLALRGLTAGTPLGVVGTVLFGVFAGLFLGLGLLGSELALLVALVGGILGGVVATMSSKNESTMVSGHPTAGWTLGLLGGLFLGVLGWALGLYALDSPMLFLVPAITTILGFAAGLLAPLKTPTSLPT